jgi:transposase InsO family protein
MSSLAQLIKAAFLPARLGLILGLKPERFYRWRRLQQEFGIEGLENMPPKALTIPGRLLPEEEEGILLYAHNHPEQHFREIQFNLEKHDIYVSPSSVYRRLKENQLIREHRFQRPRRPFERPRASAPHQHWLVPPRACPSYILIEDLFWYLIAIIDLFSRYIVGWELSPSSTARDVERTIDFALAEWGFHDKEIKPVIHSDNGPQMKAKSLKKFLRDLGTLNEYSRAHIPQDLAVLERFFRTAKQEEVYRQEYLSPLEARSSLAQFVDYYNHRRPHQGIGNVTPYDKLMGYDIDIIKERKIKSRLARDVRRYKNRLFNN